MYVLYMYVCMYIYMYVCTESDTHKLEVVWYWAGKL